MTYKISIEAIGPIGAEGFAHLVAQRIATLKEYAEHEATVRKHAADHDMAPEDRWVTLAIPQTPAEVDAAIKRLEKSDGTNDFVPDYEIVGPPFASKKAKLFDQVSAAERDAIAEVAPSGKLRAFSFREADIRAADQARYAAELAKGPTESIDFANFNDLRRPVEDTNFLEMQLRRQDRRNKIMRWAAGLHSDIEDLTPGTIDAWELKPFNG